MQPLVSISIVSHGQSALVEQALGDLRRVAVPIEVLLTINIPERQAFEEVAGDTPLRLIVNPTAKGFGANHNAAFALSSARYFCVMNPDIRLPADPFPALLAALEAHGPGVVAPRVLSPQGDVEDSARPFPTALSIAAKALVGSAALDLPGSGMAYPDWVAGMFMLFPRESFACVGGFDESFFLYYEDVDLCARLRKCGQRVGYCADVHVIHDARRTSHRNLRYLRSHAGSVLRFLWRRATGRI